MKKWLYFLIIGFPILFTLFYGSLSLVGSILTVGNIGQEEEDVIYLSSAQIHTEFILPLTDNLFAWKKVIPKEKIYLINESKYISIGWGDRGFFYHIQTWDKVKLSVLLKALFLKTPSVMHINFLSELPSHMKLYRISITHHNYQQLLSYIKNSFSLNQDKLPFLDSSFNYYDSDFFLAAKGSYHLFYSCNQWTADGLKAAGLKRPLFSPFKYGIEWSLKDLLMSP